MNAAENRPAAARRLLWGAAFALVVLTAGCAHIMMMFHGTDAVPPPASEFGYGPRVSSASLFTATVEPEGPVRVRKVHAWTLTLRDASGNPVEGAAVEVDGGMPQHGHGLPTRPRVTAYLGDGAYRVDGMRFNMGGWWEVRFRIQAAGAADSVVFNLDL